MLFGRPSLVVSVAVTNLSQSVMSKCLHVTHSLFADGHCLFCCVF